jgi:hypothetical protein
VWSLIEFERIGEKHWGEAEIGVLLPSSSFPLLVVKVEGGCPEGRAALCRDLLDRRMTAAVNIGVTKNEVFLFPRLIETAKPFYPYALGGMELFGRFVYPEEDGFWEAESKDLEQALEESLPPMQETESQAIQAVLREIMEESW